MADFVVLPIGNLTFEFEPGWRVTKYDEWAFYRRRFQAMRTGIKAVDVIALEPGGTVWFIEVKDYRQNRRSKVADLADEVAGKVFDTLAALLPSKLTGDVEEETRFAADCLGAKRLRIVLHLEQPTKHSTLFPRAIEPADVEDDMRRRVRAIDAHAVVAESSRMDKVRWTVT